MSNYTTEVRFVVGHYAGLDHNPEFQEIDTAIDAAIPYIFGRYPLYDESYRNVLNHKILRHFWQDSIGQETINMWLLYLNNKMNEIMPYYNQLYESALLTFNPLYDTDLTTDANRKTSGGEIEEAMTNEKGVATSNNTRDDTNHGTASGTSNNTVNETSGNAFQQTPQSDLDTVKQLKYLTQYTSLEGNRTDDNTNSSTTDDTLHSVDNGTTNTTRDNSGKRNTNYTDLDDYLSHVSGKTGGKSYSAMLNEFRSTFLNIDMLIIGELEPLFYGLFE